MALDIEFKWKKPVELTRNESDVCSNCDEYDKCNLTYCCEDAALPKKPGVYVFARRFGGNITPIYIGKAIELRQRIWQQLEGNVKLMNGVKKFGHGTRILLIGVFQPKRGQKTDKVLPLVEDTLIRHALARGFVLLNSSGTKRPYHTINFSGNLESRRIFPKKMNRRAK
jgi:hypothetical protein